MLPVSSGVSVWRSCGCLTKRSKLYYAEGTPSDSNNPGEKSTVEVKNKQRISTTFFFTPCPAHTAVRNTHPSHGECLCYSAALSTESAAILYKCSFTLYSLTPLGFHGATVSFYLNDTPNILKVRFQRPGVSTPTDNTENLNKAKQKLPLYLYIFFFWLLSWKMFTDTSLPCWWASLYVPKTQWSSQEHSCEDIIMLLLLKFG